MAMSFGQNYTLSFLFHTLSSLFPILDLSVSLCLSLFLSLSLLLRLSIHPLSLSLTLSLSLRQNILPTEDADINHLSLKNQFKCKLFSSINYIYFPPA